MKNLRHLYLALMLTYILGLHGENIALWVENDPEPVRIFPCRAEMLPPEARSALERGVAVDSLEELEALAENYLS